jgi:electron transport complex protein RnfC
VEEYGIVEMEGGGRPLEEILASLPPSPQTLSLVVRCVFDDPWLAADRALCRERFRAVAEGAGLAARAARAERILYALSREEEALGASFRGETEAWGFPVSVVPVGSRYPQRNRRELELVLRAYEKKECLSLGELLILGPATLAAVHDAVKFRKPILDRYVAVGGSAVREPRVMKARIGTRIRELFDECGGFTGKPRRIAAGSPLLGRELENLDEPVTKTSYAVFALREGGAGGKRGRNCIGCGECRTVCPVGLDPEELYKRITGELAEAPGECHGCGCCELVCPSALPLSSVISGTARGPGGGLSPEGR